MNYLSHPQLDSDATGVLLVNLGTPDAPTKPALRQYLKEFLSDPRVVEAPRWLWGLALYGVILNIRPARSAKAYQKVWTDEGSPLQSISAAQAAALQAQIGSEKLHVELAMRYCNPSIHDALNRLRGKGVTRLVVLPLYPQYSGSTTGSVFDAVADELKTWRWTPELHFINEYHRDASYIDAMAASIEEARAANGPARKLVYSFHGIPKRYVDSGDPYQRQCEQTAQAISARLGLSEDEWVLLFQSRFGREEWLQPYADKTLQKMPGQGVKSVDVVCPGFSADCLETLEEVNMENREIFLHAGGESYQYIPCLNDRQDHIEMMAGLVSGKV
ncbi:MAG: ferrochelatase [Gammaproteobacteria bacterium]|nr:MAG: ferrochelatase [Gammaproteobacteria bacterium]